jgi:hypothetical protein
MVNETSADRLKEVTESNELISRIAGGMSLRAAAKELDMPLVTASRRFNAELKRAMDEHAEVRDMLVHRDLETLRQLLEAWMPLALAGSHEAAKVVLGVLDRHAKWLGFEAAQKHEVSVQRVDELVALIARQIEATAGAVELRRYDSIPQDGD